MQWYAMLRNGKKVPVKGMIIKPTESSDQEDSIYLFSCLTKLKNLKIVTNPESDIVGFQCFSCFNRPITNLLEIDPDVIPGYNIKNNIVEILGTVVNF